MAPSQSCNNSVSKKLGYLQLDTFATKYVPSCYTYIYIYIHTILALKGISPELCATWLSRKKKGAISGQLLHHFAVFGAEKGRKKPALNPGRRASLVKILGDLQHVNEERHQQGTHAET